MKFIALCIVSLLFCNLFAQDFEINHLSNSNDGIDYMIEPEENVYILSGDVGQTAGCKDYYAYLLKVFNSGDTISKRIIDNGYSVSSYNVRVFLTPQNQPAIIYRLRPCKDSTSPSWQPNISDYKLVFAYIDDELNLFNRKEIQHLNQNEEYIGLDEATLLFDTDSTIILGMNVYSLPEMFHKGKRFIRYSNDGDTIKTGRYTRQIETLQMTFNHDSSLIYIWNHGGCRAVFDKDFNLISDFDEGIFYLFLHTAESEYCSNPNNAKCYCGFSGPTSGFKGRPNVFKEHANGFCHNSDSKMMMEDYDLNFVVIEEDKTISCSFTQPYSLSRELIAPIMPISFTSNNLVYGTGAFNFHGQTKALIYCFDETLNKISELYYNYNKKMPFIPFSIFSTRDNGCLVLGEHYDEQILYIGTLIAKFSPEVFVSIEEAHNNGLAVAVAYPNPGSERLCIRTTVPKAELEVFDMMGRTVAKQIISETETAVNTTIWQAGTYLWRVYSEGKVAETGKWVKR